MKNLEMSSTKPLAPVPKRVVFAFLVVSFIGFVDAAYLTVKHYLGTPLNCSILEGCETVTTSQYAMIGNIPVALLGTLYYLAVFILTIAYLDTKRENLFAVAARLTIVGFLASLLFLYLQLFVIKAICLYCVVSAITSTALFILGIFVIKYKRSNNNVTSAFFL